MRNVYSNIFLGGNDVSKIEETLWTNYDEINSLMDGIDVGSKEFGVLVEERDRIRKELINIDQFDQEIDTKISQIECDNMKDRIHNLITIGTFTITTGISLYAISKTFKFDQIGTITSTLGRNILNGVVPKLGKR